MARDGLLDHPRRETSLPLPRLIGRDREECRVVELIDSVHDRGSVLLVRGEAGIGKSSLLAFAMGRAGERGMRILTTAGVQSESQYPFAGLHRLLRPILGSVELPVPQRDSIQAAFGMVEGATPNSFLIALAALNLLGNAATVTPLLLIVDDAQWLDRSTAEALAFVARRLESDSIILLIAIRDGSGSCLGETGLPELRLEALDEAAAGAVLDAHAPDLSAASRGQVLEYSAGNPLALVELPITVRSDIPSGEAPLHARLPLTDRLESVFGARGTVLPQVTRSLLLAAAANDADFLEETLAATTLLEGAETGVEVLAPAVAAGLVEPDGLELRFRHPLMRSAIYQMATLSARYAAHSALAQVLEDQPIRHAWHRAASIGRSDESVAAELEAAARQAQQRGAVISAVAGLERAAMLTPDQHRRSTRFLRATELAFELGRRELVIRLLHRAEPHELASIDDGRMAFVKELIKDSSQPNAARVRYLTDLADQISVGGDGDLALALLQVAAFRCWRADHGDETRGRIVAAATRVPVAEADPRRLAILAIADPIAHGPDVMGRLTKVTIDRRIDPRTMLLLGQAAYVVGDMARAAVLLQDTVINLRAQSRLGLLVPALTLRAWAAIHLGDWKVALLASEEADRLGSETAQNDWLASARTAKATLAGLRGETSSANVYADEAEQIALPTGERALLAAVQGARGMSSIGDGRHGDAYEHLRRIFNATDSAFHPMEGRWALGYLAEAAVHSGNQCEARVVIDSLEPLVKQTPSHGLQIRLGYARAVLAIDSDAEVLYRAALDVDLARWPLARARLQLAYGTWLRRQRRTVESRAPLRAAREAFDALGAIPWAKRARTELRASGVTCRPRSVGVSDQLSPQELEIAQMAGEGLSNREIGQQLFLSPRTVSSHLYRIFPKLGITSRHQLPDVLRA